MMIQIENLKPGQTYYLSTGGYPYKFLRFAGEVDMPNRNQWGRSEGGTHRALVVCAMADYGRKGKRFTRTGFRLGSYVRIED